MQIEHDPDEPPRDMTGNWIYWAASAMVVLMWTINLLYIPLDWNSVRLGFLTGGVFMIVGRAITGDKVPSWMRR
jgi:hypothetical protein